MMQSAPLLSSSSVPSAAKVGLAFFTAAAIAPWVIKDGYPIPEAALSYGFMIVGEILVGIIIGFFLNIIYSVFLVSGQFFSMQMGFGASQVYDPLAQVQIPLMGQFLNIMAMYIFITIGGFQKFFLVGVFRSFQTIRPYDLLSGKDYLFNFFLRSIGNLFEQGLIIAFPILGTLFLVSITMGLLAKAAPQMNLLMLGFPINISVAFIVLFLAIPFLVEVFASIIDYSFAEVKDFIIDISMKTEGVVR